MLGAKEQLLVAQAFFNVLGEALATGRDDNLRGVVAKNYRDIYELSGGESRTFHMMLDGQEVADFYFPKTKGKDGWTEEAVTITNPTDFKTYISEQPADDFRAFVEDNQQLYAEWLSAQGVEASGTKRMSITHPAEAPHVNFNGTLKWKPMGREIALTYLSNHPEMLTSTTRGYLDETVD